ncbi:MAG: hypothetical protein D6733_00800 [Methanobacteriota archaeon]|nr:MAG: hypothetical protein D6733_00800 [Euryarchaeota archaeon]
MKKDKTTILLISFLIVAVAYSILPSQSKLAGSHSVYKVRTGASMGDIYFCAKCHPDVAGNISTTFLYKAHGAVSACICHGYYPNYTNLGGANISINLQHNLTKNIYCTNCHTGYNATGDIPIGNGRSGVNQSGHYIFLNESNKTDVYERAYRYFNQSPFGPLE